eukprot:867267-Pyramimonas_sp.AAC.1
MGLGPLMRDLPRPTPWACARIPARRSAGARRLRARRCPALRCPCRTGKLAPPCIAICRDGRRSITSSEHLLG